MNQVERGDRPPGGHAGVWNPPIPASASGGKGPVQRIMFASQKGGVAKTASAVNVAVALGQKGLRTLLVDTDPIGSVAACFGIDRAARPSRGSTASITGKWPTWRSRA